MSQSFPWSPDVPFSSLKGEVITKTHAARKWGKIEELHFVCESGNRFRMYHEQDCCASVILEDITEDWGNILTGEVMDCHKCSNESETQHGSETWTFYRITTRNGTVVMRWYGSSNGYYSEQVNFKEVSEPFSWEASE